MDKYVVEAVSKGAVNMAIRRKPAPFDTRSMVFRTTWDVRPVPS